jgi:hypothetical protein
MSWYGWLTLIGGLTSVACVFLFPLLTAARNAGADQEDEHEQGGIG